MEASRVQRVQCLAPSKFILRVTSRSVHKKRYLQKKNPHFPNNNGYYRQVMEASKVQREQCLASSYDMYVFYFQF